MALLTFSHVTSGTNLAVSFLERPNSQAQQRESVCVYEGEKERSCHADTITNIQTHNKEKAKEGKQAEACHAGGMQTTDTGRQRHKLLHRFKKVLEKYNKKQPQVSMW